ncbi:MAG: tRNA 4-thiouridine(8) synthase ThiI [Clostridiales bacterium]|nr:tRNA 4-thiouridine(8) synthase ThiI [Clostridiales bacterium]
MNAPALLVKYGEIALRGGNRKIYEDMLIEAIKKRLSGYLTDFTVRKDQGRFFIECGNPEAAGKLHGLAGIAAAVFGIAGCCPCVMTEDNSLENIYTLALAHVKERYPAGGSFKVFASRADKSYPLTSGELAADIGAYLLKNATGLTVNLKKPDFRLYVEIRSRTYIYSDAIKGPGGLPPGSGGKAVLLLSGGFDSPVAGYMAARRGVELICAYFHSPPYTSERAKEKVVDLAKRLASYTGGVTLYTIPFTDTQLYINAHTAEAKQTIFLKRAMLKTASVIADNEAACALVTGDSIGQVASQTMQALNAVDSAAGYPVLRPLCGMDKLDIINIAQKIGTHDISARPYADCCTLFVAKHPETKPKRTIIEGIERKLTELDGLIAKAVSNAEILKI